MSVVDNNLAWGQTDLTPEEVKREIKGTLWGSEPFVRYSGEWLTPEGEDVESIYDVHGAPVPFRGLILRVMLAHAGERKPWKARIKSNTGEGWLVVDTSGWRFYHKS